MNTSSSSTATPPPVGENCGWPITTPGASSSFLDLLVVLLLLLLLLVGGIGEGWRHGAGLRMHLQDFESMEDVRTDVRKTYGSLDTDSLAWLSFYLSMIW